MQQLTNLHYQRLFESAPGLYLILQPDLIIAGVSNAYLKATMTTRETITGRALFDVFPDNPNDPGATGTTNLRKSLETVLKTGEPHAMAVQKYPIRRPDGSFEERYWKPLNTPVFDDEKNISLIIHNVVDVTEMELLKLEETKRAEAYDSKLKELNEQLKQQLKEKTRMIMDIFERITDGFIALDKNFCYTYANKRIGELTHRNPASLIGRNVWEEFPEAIGSATYLAFKTALEEQRYICNTDYFEPFDLWQENHIYPSADGLSVFIRDITQRKKTELKLEKSNEELHRLAAHLQNIREMEQKRIAREIHDELGQQITGLKMDVAWMKKKVNGHEKVGFLHEKLDQMTELLDMSVQTVRKISSSLRPSLLDDLGLVAALEWQTKEFEKRFGIRARFVSSQTSMDIHPDLATGLFRLYQESLTNVARHAQAGQVTGNLDCKDYHIILHITDDGKGFDQKPGANMNTMGLLGMKERVLMMGGTLTITSTPGKGTTITADVPIQQYVPDKS